MSHIVVVKTQIRDAAALAAACRRLQLPEPVHGKATLFSGEITGMIVRLKGWEYPIAIDPANGDVSADHFNGAWGDPVELDRLTQAYAIEKIHLESHKKGLRVTETPLEDGSVKLQILEGV